VHGKEDREEVDQVAVAEPIGKPAIGGYLGDSRSMIAMNDDRSIFEGANCAKVLEESPKLALGAPQLFQVGGIRALARVRRVDLAGGEVA
jgi:hypothetical protein